MLTLREVSLWCKCDGWGGGSLTCANGLAARREHRVSERSLTEGCMAVGSGTYTKDIGRLVTRASSAKVQRTDSQETGATYDRDLSSLGWHDRYEDTA